MIKFHRQAKLTLGAFRVAPELFLGITVAEKIFESYGVDVVILSALEGHNNHHSLGKEVDLGAPAENLKDIATDLQAALLDSYVVRVEGTRIHMVFPNG